MTAPPEATEQRLDATSIGSDPGPEPESDLGGLLEGLQCLASLLSEHTRSDEETFARVRGLRQAVKGVLQSIDRAALSPRGRTFVRRIERSFSDIDTLPADERLARIRRTLSAIEQRLGQTPDPGPAGAAQAPRRRPDAPERELAPDFTTPIRSLRGVGPVKGDLLALLGIQTVADLLHHLPRDYQDRTTATPIDKLEPGAFAVVAGEITGVRAGRGRRMRFLEIAVSDGTGDLLATWFRPAAYLHKAFEKGREVLLMGKVEAKTPPLRMSHPEFEDLGSGDGLHSGVVVPVYSTPEGLGQRALRKLVFQAFQDFGTSVPDRVPNAAQEELRLPRRAEALRALHFPDSPAELESLRAGDHPAHEALLWEDLFLLQVALMRRRAVLEGEGLRCEAARPGSLRKALVEALPFELTGAQERALGELDGDLAAGKMMQRLIQGDVGSGKTVVGLLAAAPLIQAGNQVAVLAPTEVLAYQWWQRARELYGSQGQTVALLTGAQRAAARRHNRELASSGRAGLVVGTHALFQEGVDFARLALVVVDEQQRFGVFQRARLLEKGPQPHLLAMTATPIPRSLALTLFGDLDVTLIDELPPRGQIHTRALGATERVEAYTKVRAAAEAGGRIYVVCPRIEGPGEGRAVVETAQELAADWLSGIRLGVLHGRMDAAAKDRAIERFRDGDLQVLVSTTVVEVGVDVPEATVMVVEDAHRFGLSQLHQLRGRVGRSQRDGTCFLLTDRDLSERLTILEACNDGFRIAEEDLRLRGPGDLVGARQAGAPAFRLSTSPRFLGLLDSARRHARAVAQRPDFQTAPGLSALRAAVSVRLEASAVIEAG